MPSWSERSGVARAALGVLDEQLNDLDQAMPSLAEATESVNRLRLVNATAWSYLEGAPDALVSDGMLGDLASTASNLAETIRQQVANALAGTPLNWAMLSPDSLLEVLGRWPMPLPEAAAKVLRDAAQLLSATAESQVNALKAEHATVVDSWSASFAELQTASETWRAELAARVEAGSTEVTSTETRIDAALVRLNDAAEAFSTTTAALQRKETDENAELRAELRLAAETDRLRFGSNAQETLQSLEAELQQAKKIVGLIAGTGMAGGYQQYSATEDTQANRWRRGSVWTGFVAAALLTAGVVITAIQTQHGQTVTNGDIVGRFLLAASLGGIATYMAKQASHHRARADRAKSTQLALESMAAYLEPLDDDKRKATLEDFAYVFFMPNELTESPEDEAGPGMATTIRTALAQRRQH